jgi:Bacterial EndoU nuclease
MLKLKMPVVCWISAASVVTIVASTVLVAYAAPIAEDFEAGVKPSYAAADVSLNTGIWNLSDALISGDGFDRKNGTRAARVRNNGKVSMKFNRSSGAGVVTVKHAKYGNDSNTSWQFWCSANSGSTWSQIGSTVTTNSTSLQIATFTPNIAGQVRCEVRKTDGTSNRTNIDDIQIADYGVSVTPLPSGTVPFFDAVNNPKSGLKYPAGVAVDVTPVPPTLNAFDQAVSNVCGVPGKKVSRTEFQTLMTNNPTVLASIKARMGISSSLSDTVFLNDLTNIWFNAEGFNHVLCGEPVSGGAIGGLHFAGRYLQLQNQGLAGRLDNNTANEEVVSGAIYTIGAKMIVNDATAQSSIKGFGYTLNAEDILAIGGYAYNRNPNSGSTSRACNLSLTDDGNSFTTIFVAKTNGVRTFYPDATPSSANPTCAQ